MIILHLTYCILGNFSWFLSSADFFQNKLFEKILSGIPSECQTVWTLIRPDVLSDLIWVQIVCQGYQQTTLVDKELILYATLLLCCELRFFNISKKIYYGEISVHSV